MKIEIELDEIFFTKEKLKEITRRRINKLIAIKAGIAKIKLSDVIMDLVCRAAMKKINERENGSVKEKLQ